jgi:colanic acid biosynthesis glycosyl transferase WcaI
VTCQLGLKTDPAVENIGRTFASFSPRFAVPTLLILSQTYPPDPAAVGQHIADVAERMVERGWRVVVFTSRRGYDDPSKRYRWRETLRGVEVRRVAFSSFGKGAIAVRLAAQVLFMIQAFARGLFTGGVSAILVSTSPPFAGYAGNVLAALRRVPFVWWVMDINPDQMVKSGKLRATSLISRVFEWMNRLTLKGARRVIVLDRYMRDCLLRKADVAYKIAIVPPWSHDIVRENLPHDRNPFRQLHGFGDSIVVMYSGNHGYSTPLDTLLATARQLEGESRLKFVFIGGGVIKRQIDEMVDRESPPNIVTFPYQPLSELRFSLASADVHVVSLANEGAGVVHPCKVYGALAIGRPIIALAPRESYLADILEKYRVGWLVEHGDVEKLRSVLRDVLRMDKKELEAMGEAAREAAQTKFQRQRLLDDVCDIVADLAEVC